MSAAREVASFEDLWERRTTIESGGGTIDLLSAEDLAIAKRTQRDKDWPMIRRLVEQDYQRSRTCESRGRETVLRKLPRETIVRLFNFSVSPDGEFAVFPRLDNAVSDLMLIENFR